MNRESYAQASTICQTEIGPDRSIDAAIARTLGYEVVYDGRDPEPYYEPVKGYSWQPVPRFTGSINAATTLIPKGIKEMVARNLKDDRWHSTLSFLDESWFHMTREGANAALALCATALHALEVLEGRFVILRDRDAEQWAELDRVAQSRWLAGPEIVLGTPSDKDAIGEFPEPKSSFRSNDTHRRECQSVWRSAVGDIVGALDVLKNRWTASRRRHEREAGQALGRVLDAVWKAREPAAGSYDEAAEVGKGLIEQVKAAIEQKDQA